jgi:amidase
MSDRREFLKAGMLTTIGAAVAPKLSVAQGAQQAATVPPFALDEITVNDLQRGMQSGKYTSESVTQAYLTRISGIDRSGPTLHAVIEVNPDAGAIAKQMDAERKAGKLRGPLHGVPVLIKDNISTADKMETTAGSLALVGAGAPHGRDAFVAGQLRKAGAVILGKTNLSEWANFRSTHSSSGWSGRGGQTRNPFALDRDPSGSSSGSGSAVSANLCAVAIGTETDGSIVSPSTANGVVGIKPTVGLVSRSGIVPISHTQDTAGPMARSVADAAALLSVIAGVDPNDQATAAAQGKIQDYTRALDPNGLKGARLGIVRKLGGDYGPATNKVFDDALAALKQAGAEIVDIGELKLGPDLGEAEQAVLQYEFKADLNKYLASLGPGAKVRTLEDIIHFNDQNAATELKYFGQELLLQSQEKGGLDSDEYKKELDTCRRKARAEGIDATMDTHHVDALISPTGTPAWLIDLVNGDGAGSSDSSLPAVAGYPHVTVPMGFVWGLPVGLSFIGRAWSEATLIKFAYAFEQATKHRQAPKFLHSVNVG